MEEFERQQAEEDLAEAAREAGSLFSRRRTEGEGTVLLPRVLDFTNEPAGFGAEFQNKVPDSFGSGRGQCRSQTMVGSRPKPARIGLKPPTSPPETGRPASRN